MEIGTKLRDEMRDEIQVETPLTSTIASLDDQNPSYFRVRWPLDFVNASASTTGPESIYDTSTDLVSMLPSTLEYETREECEDDYRDADWKR